MALRQCWGVVVFLGLLPLAPAWAAEQWTGISGPSGQDAAPTSLPVPTLADMDASYGWSLTDEEPAEAAVPIADVVAPSGTACGHTGHCCPRCRKAAAAEPWHLPQPCLLQRTGFVVGGWLQQGITFNAVDPGDGFNGPVATNDMDSNYQMNQLWLFLHRPADTGGCGWALGGHVDMLFGTDWRFGVNHGLEDRIHTFSNQDYGMVIPQAYLEVAFNNLSVKLGHFAAILDYEVIPGPMNPFYSHSYGYGYGVPQLVTGALGDYKVSDHLSVQAGFHRGWFMFEDYDNNLDFMGGVKLQTCDGRTSLAYSLSTGRQSFQPVAPLSDQNRFTYSLVFQHQMTEKLRVRAGAQPRL